jgi:phenylpyruvate tautomerase PptA (4-oxalocrotonate tautomerase family)
MPIASDTQTNEIPHMPTYLCYAAANQLTSEQKAAIAEAITSAHSDEAAAPRYLVQVIFDDLEASDNYIGSKPAPVHHIWIRADIRAGRTEAQKSNLQSRIVRELTMITKSPPSAVWVYLNELLPANMVEFGQVLPPPGKESEWFRELSEDLKEQLTEFDQSSEV